MSRFAYAICYCRMEQKVLVFQKRNLAFFYGHEVRVVEGRTESRFKSFYRYGISLVNGANSICFPGGKIEAVDVSVAAAGRREFKEETGIDLERYQYAAGPVISFNRGLDPNFPFPPGNKINGAIYIFSAREYNRLFCDVHESLEMKNNIVSEINRKARSKHLSRKDWDSFNATAIQDDELQWVRSAENIKSFYMQLFNSQDPNTAWFHEMMRRLSYSRYL